MTEGRETKERLFEATFRVPIGMTEDDFIDWSEVDPQTAAPTVEQQNEGRRLLAEFKPTVSEILDLLENNYDVTGPMPYALVSLKEITYEEWTLLQNEIVRQNNILDQEGR